MGFCLFGSWREGVVALHLPFRSAKVPTNVNVLVLRVTEVSQLGGGMKLDSRSLVIIVVVCVLGVCAFFAFFNLILLR
jgi:hypothetical protein